MSGINTMDQLGFKSRKPMGPNSEVYGVIYETIYLKDGSTYIGQTTKKGKLFDEYFGSGEIIKRIQKKHGIGVFKKRILYECYSKEEMDKVEKFYRHKEKLSKRFSGENNPNFQKFGKESIFSKKVKCVELDEIFDGVREAAKKVNLANHSGISQCCLGKRKTAA